MAITTRHGKQVDLSLVSQIKMEYRVVRPASELSLVQSGVNFGSSTQPLSFSSMNASDVIWWLIRSVSHIP